MRLALAFLLLLVTGVAAPADAADTKLDDLLFDLQLVPIQGHTTPPAFELERFDDRKVITLAEYRGRPVMLYFWATW